MPKRVNPFGDHTCLQLKTHVREKEVDKGVNQQVRMHSVYEKTQALLFSGMRQLHDMKSAPANCNDSRIVDSELPNKTDNSTLRQLHLNKNCELVCVDEEMETELASCQPPSLQDSGCFAQKVCNVSSETFNHIPPDSSGTRWYPEELGSSCNQPQKTEQSACKAGQPFASKEPCNPFLLMKSAHSRVLSHEKSLLGLRACHNCRGPVQSKDVMKCQFCENFVCCPCVRQCSACHLHYCQLCSVLNYNESVEKAYCLSCSKNR